MYYKQPYQPRVRLYPQSRTAAAGFGVAMVIAVSASVAMWAIILSVLVSCVP